MTLRKAVEMYPDKVGVVDGDLSFTYTEMGKRIGALANFLRAQGIETQDRLAILEVNSHELFESYYAAAGIGAILSPLNYRLSAKEIAFILSDAGAKLLIAGSQFDSLVEGILSEETGSENAAGHAPPQ